MCVCYEYNKIQTNITGKPTIKGPTKKEEPLPGRMETLPENEGSGEPRNSVSWRVVQRTMSNAIGQLGKINLKSVYLTQFNFKPRK